MTDTATSQAAVPTTMELKTTVSMEYAEVALEPAHKNMVVMASLEAPTLPCEERDSRAPIDLCCVLDRSGSMSGEKLDLCRASLHYVLQQLKPMDRMTLVTFDNQVQNVFSLVPMDSAGKDRASEAVNKVRSGGSTNLSGGLFEGLTLMAQRDKPLDVTSVILFTDGHANHGLKTTDELVPAMQNLLKTLGSCSVFTFGFGDHDATMLRSIADAGLGMYYYIPQMDEIPQAFGDCLGGLLTVAAQNVKVSLALSGEYCVEQVLSEYRKEMSEDKKKVELNVGDIYSEEKKDLLLLVSVPEATEEGDQLVGIVSTQCFNTATSQLETSTQECRVRRVATVSSSAIPSTIVGRQRNRLLVADALKRATAEEARGNLDAARKILEDAMEAVAKSSTGSHEYCLALVDDVKKVAVAMQDRQRYRSEGWSNTMQNMTSCHTQQRCTSTAYSPANIQTSQTSYNTMSKKSRMFDSADYCLKSAPPRASGSTMPTMQLSSRFHNKMRFDSSDGGHLLPPSSSTSTSGSGVPTPVVAAPILTTVVPTPTPTSELTEPTPVAPTSQTIEPMATVVPAPTPTASEMTEPTPVAPTSQTVEPTPTVAPDAADPAQDDQGAEGGAAPAACQIA